VGCESTWLYHNFQNHARGHERARVGRKCHRASAFRGPLACRRERLLALQGSSARFPPRSPVRPQMSGKGQGDAPKKRDRSRKKSGGGGAAARGRGSAEAAADDAEEPGQASPTSAAATESGSGEVITYEKKAVVSWDDKVKMLEAFNQLHGHVCVPKHDAELGWWVQQCRQMHNSGKMPDDKRERLERLGFVWCGQEAKRIREQAEGKTVSSWDDRFRSLMEFREVHGHTCVPMQRHDPGNT